MAQASGVEGADQAAVLNDALQGQGFGKGTQRKLLSAAKKGARVGEKLVNEFGSDDQKRKVATGRKVAEIVSGSGARGFLPMPKASKKAAPAEALRKMVSRGVAHS